MSTVTKPTQTNATRRSSGRKRLSIWLPEQTMQRLDEMCADGGYTRTEHIAALIDCEYLEWQGVVPTPHPSVSRQDPDEPD